MKALTKDEKLHLAALKGLEFKAVCAVQAVEAAGSGFDQVTGLIKIQFEPYYFRTYTGIRVANGVEKQAAEWQAFNEAAKINAHAAMMSTSWGLGQIMGFNHKAAGYDTVEKMVDAFKVSEYNQMLGMLNFICNDARLVKAIHAKDWNTFARIYNGPGYKNNPNTVVDDYDYKLSEAYKLAPAS
jgi:hypothetical protein